MEFTDQPAWECRHGAFLGLKYILSVVNLNRDTIVNGIYPRVYEGLKDVVDDVVSEAAAALIPVVKQFVHHIDLNKISELLWNCLTDLDDLTGSTQSTLKLLSEILKITSPDNNPEVPLQELIPRLFPFLHHSSSGKIVLLYSIIENYINLQPSVLKNHQYYWSEMSCNFVKGAISK